jgi:hypothetical protein
MALLPPHNVPLIRPGNPMPSLVSSRALYSRLARVSTLLTTNLDVDGTNGLDQGICRQAVSELEGMLDEQQKLKGVLPLVSLVHTE